MIFTPPRHGKSEYVSHWLPVWFLKSFPDKRVALASYEKNFATSWGRKVRDTIKEHPELGIEISKSQYAASDWGIEKHDGAMVSTGIGGPLTGKGADLLIVDDPVKNAEEALSPAVRESHWQWWQSTALTRLQPGGGVVLIMTRWHRDDLAGRILHKAQEDGEEWDVVRLPAIAGFDDELGRLPGEALWPEQYNIHALETRKRSVDIYWWNALYDQRPTQSDSAEWPDEYFGDHIWCEEEDWPTHFDLTCVALDPSKGKDAKRGDYSAIVFIGIHDGFVYVDADLKRRPTTQIIEDLHVMCDHTRPQFVGIEANQFQELLIGDYDRYQKEHSAMPLPVWSMNNMVKKTIRIRRLGPYLARHEIRLRRSSPGCQLLYDQLKDFDHGDHDDGPDALEMAIRLPIEAGGGVVSSDGLGHNLLGEVA